MPAPDAFRNWRRRDWNNEFRATRCMAEEALAMQIHAHGRLAMGQSAVQCVRADEFRNSRRRD
jgi:hypothetical protein